MLANADPGFWVAVGSMVGTLITALAGVLNNWLSTKPKIAALEVKVQASEGKIESLETENEDCRKAREAMNEDLSHKWPSDPSLVQSVMASMKAAGIVVTLADVARVLRLNGKARARIDASSDKEQQ